MVTCCTIYVHLNHQFRTIYVHLNYLDTTRSNEFKVSIRLKIKTVRVDSYR